MSPSPVGSTFAAVLAAHLRADPGRPLVTFYDERTGERVELSVATFSNWVAKTSSLLVEEYDLERGDTIRIDLPTHWLTPVFLGAAWTCGLIVTTSSDHQSHRDADLVICGPEGLGTYAASDDPQPPVLATALLPLGARFPAGSEVLPGGVLDFGGEVWGQPDAFDPFDPPSGDDEATPGITHSSLLATTSLPSGTRLLTTENPVGPEGPRSFIDPLVAAGSTVWVRRDLEAEHAGTDAWSDRYRGERAGVIWG